MIWRESEKAVPDAVRAGKPCKIVGKSLMDPYRYHMSILTRDYAVRGSKG